MALRARRLRAFAAAAALFCLLALVRHRLPAAAATWRQPSYYTAPFQPPWAPNASLYASSERCSPSDAHSASPEGLARKRRNVVRMEALDAAAAGGYLLPAQDPLRAPCGSGLVRGVSARDIPAAYGDFGRCMALAAAAPATRFCGARAVLYHTFWAAPPARPQTAWAIAAFLATQDPARVLWVWSFDAPALARDPLLAPFSGCSRVLFKQWDAAREAGAGSPLAGAAFAGARDPSHYLASDLLRVVALARHGGVYFDADVLLLRDFGPLLGEEFAYQWGSHCTWSNNAVVRLHPNSSLAQRLVAAIAAAPKAAPNSVAWGRDAWGQAAPFLRLPACFFNPTWGTNFEGAAASLSKNAHPGRWRGAFAYHLHSPVYAQGPRAHPGSEYAGATRELLQLLGAREARGDWAVRRGLTEQLRAALLHGNGTPGAA